MATLEQRFEWLKEILEEKPEDFADYYKDDFANYLDIEYLEVKNLAKFLGKKFSDFNRCENKEDVRELVNKITSYIVMHAQIEEIIADYLA